MVASSWWRGLTKRQEGLLQFAASFAYHRPWGLPAAVGSPNRNRGATEYATESIAFSRDKPSAKMSAGPVTSGDLAGWAELPPGSWRRELGIARGFAATARGPGQSQGGAASCGLDWGGKLTRTVGRRDCAGLDGLGWGVSLFFGAGRETLAPKQSPNKLRDATATLTSAPAACNSASGTSLPACPHLLACISFGIVRRRTHTQQPCCPRD